MYLVTFRIILILYYICISENIHIHNTILLVLNMLNLLFENFRLYKRLLQYGNT